jgi:hypothetical protein
VNFQDLQEALQVEFANASAERLASAEMLRQINESEAQNVVKPTFGRTPTSNPYSTEAAITTAGGGT